MSRPKPTILLEHIEHETYKIEQILEADAIWAVFYKGKPFNLKAFNMDHLDKCPKYKKVSFSNRGHAINLAKRLNKVFKSRDFEVFELTSGTPISLKRLRF